jgi:hypothetical protein
MAFMFQTPRGNVGYADGEWTADDPDIVREILSAPARVENTSVITSPAYDADMSDERWLFLHTRRVLLGMFFDRDAVVSTERPVFPDTLTEGSVE